MTQTFDSRDWNYKRLCQQAEDEYKQKIHFNITVTTAREAWSNNKKYNYMKNNGNCCSEHKASWDSLLFESLKMFIMLGQI